MTSLVAVALLITLVLAAISLDFALQVPDQQMAFPADDTMQLVLGDGAVRTVRYIAAEPPDLRLAAAGAAWAGLVALVTLLAVAGRIFLASRRRLAVVTTTGARIVALDDFRVYAQSADRGIPILPSNEHSVAVLDDLYGKVLDAQAEYADDPVVGAELAAVRARLEQQLHSLLENLDREGLERAA
jgi:hypothetical protein